MLPPKWMIFIVTAWILITIICLTCEGVFIGSDQASVLTGIMENKLFTSDTILGKISGLVSTDLWGSVLKMVTFNYAIFYGSWAIFKWIVLMPLSIMAMWSVIWSSLYLIRGIGNI